MRNIHFYKYQALGNDFILIDDRKTDILSLLNETIMDGLNKSTPFTNNDEKLTTSVSSFSEEILIQKLCNRKFGIGADGILIIKDNPEYDFEIIYYNSDGSLSFCCNGTRSAIQYLCSLENIKKENILDLGNVVSEKIDFQNILKGDQYIRIKAFDGVHKAKFEDGMVKLEMKINKIGKINNDLFINTGAPHLIKFVKNSFEIEVEKISRNLKKEIKEPTNITFVSLEKESGSIFAATYEKGVEEETLACGTGAVAAAISANIKYNITSPINVKMKGGNLYVEFQKNEKGDFDQIYIKGEAKKVFEGNISILDKS